MTFEINKNVESLDVSMKSLIKDLTGITFVKNKIYRDISILEHSLYILEV